MLINGKAPQIGAAPKWTCTIGVPSGVMVHADFAFALVAMASRVPGRLAMCNVKSSVIAKSRNVCVAAAKQVGTTHLLFLDSDMTFPQDTLLRLIDWDKDIVGATYVQRVPPHRILGSRLDDAVNAPQSGLIEMGEMPTGCLLIKMSVFEKFEAPWFHDGIDAKLGETIGEDILFCREAVAKGFRIFCDMGLSRQIGHIGEHIFTIGEIESIPVDVRKAMLDNATRPVAEHFVEPPV